MNFKINVSRIFLYLCALLLVLYSVGPFIWILISSLGLEKDLFSIPASIFPKHFTLVNYINLFNDTYFLNFLLNSIYVTIGTIFIGIAVATLAAYSLTRFNYHGKNLFTIFSLFAYMLPSVLLVLPLYLLAVNLRLTNNLNGLIFAYIALGLPYSILMMRAFFQGVPIEYEESAFVDGASRLRTLFSIVIPISLPGIIATAVFLFVLVWNEYLFALVFLSSDLKMTFPVGLQSFISPHFIYWDYILSASVLVSIPALIVFLITQKALIKGWGVGGIKG